jgi:hypothetical protein
MWILARKPLDGTVAQNVLAHGTGALNIDASRVGWASDSDKASGRPASMPGPHVGFDDKAFATRDRSQEDPTAAQSSAGRWPPNAAFSHAPCCRRVGERKIARAGGVPQTDRNEGIFGRGLKHGNVYGGAEGVETVSAWECLAACSCGLTVRAPAGGAPPVCECGEVMWFACPVAELDRQSGSRQSGVRKGLGYGGAAGDGGPAIEASEGGASRYFPCFDGAQFLYAAKPSTAEKSDGLDEKNTHPTVKGQTLLRYLSRLICPPGGVILDAFAGSGSGGPAALAEGFRWIGIEREPSKPGNPPHIEEARARCRQAELDLEQERNGQRRLF